MDNYRLFNKVFDHQKLTSERIKQEIDKKIERKDSFIKAFTIIILKVALLLIMVFNISKVGIPSKDIITFDFNNYDIVDTISNSYNDRLYCKLDDLYKVSDLVIIGTANQINKMYVENYGMSFIMTEQNFTIKEVIKGSNIKNNININYRGGVVKVSEYIKGIDTAYLQKHGYDKYTTYELENKYIRELVWDAPIEVKNSITDYLIFLRYDEENDNYFVLSDGYGLRAIDKQNRTKIPDSNDYEIFNYR